MTIASPILIAVTGFSVGGSVCFVAGIVYERWTRSRRLHSLPLRDPADLLEERARDCEAMGLWRVDQGLGIHEVHNG